MAGFGAFGGVCEEWEGGGGGGCEEGGLLRGIRRVGCC